MDYRRPGWLHDLGATEYTGASRTMIFAEQMKLLNYVMQNEWMSLLFPGTTPIHMARKALVLFGIAILADIPIITLILVRYLFFTALNPFMGLIVLLGSIIIAALLVAALVRRIARYCKGRIRFTPANLFVLGAFIFFIGGCMDGLLFGFSTLDIMLHDTYFVVATAHIMLIPALAFLIFAAIYWSFSRLTGNEMNALMCYVHFAITLFGIGLIYYSERYTDLVHAPRRYVDLNYTVDPGGIADVYVFFKYIIWGLIGGQVIFIVNLIYSTIRYLLQRG